MKFYLFFACLLLSSICNGQTVQHQSTTGNPGRFEIVQSTLLNRLLFKIDKFTGQTFQIVQSRDSSIVWQSISIKKHFLSNIKNEGRSNYQIFLSGFMAKLTILMNINTGATWQLVQDSQTDEVFWDPIN